MSNTADSLADGPASKSADSNISLLCDDLMRVQRNFMLQTLDEINSHHNSLLLKFDNMKQLLDQKSNVDKNDTILNDLQFAGASY